MNDLKIAAQRMLDAIEDSGHKFDVMAATEALRAALAEPVQEPVATLIAQRDALLEALKYVDKELSKHGRKHWPEAVNARAAIKAVEETK